jgi:hypothetical protein
MRAFSLAIVSWLLMLGTAHAKSYSNRDYGFHVELPNDRTACLTAPPGPNHGLVVLLASSDCDRLLEAARIEVFIHYNVPSEAESTAELTKDVCVGSPSWPANMKLGYLRVRRCDIKAGGTISRETYFALRPMPGEWAGQWIVFEISLYCRIEDRTRYTGSVRRLVSEIRLTRQW